MQFIREGKQYEVLLEDYYLTRFEFAGDITIHFQAAEPQDWTIKLILSSHFRLMRGKETQTYQVDDLQGFQQLTNLWQDQVQFLKAGRNGTLQLKTRGGALLEIEDGPFENWDFWAYKERCKRESKTHLIGGMGRLVII